MAAHLKDHLLNFYLSEAHETIDKAQKGKLIQDDADAQADVIIQVQQQIEQFMNGFAEQLAQIDQAAQQYAPQPQMPPDSSMQIAQMNAQAQDKALQARTQMDQAKMQQDAQLKQAEMAQRAQETQAKISDDQAARQEDMMQEHMKQEAEDKRNMKELQVRQDMNNSDNDTAMRIVSAEIQTGEKSNLSTGTGINP
jgi:hypothetical protein